MPREEGQFLVEDYFANVEGLNTSDSPFMVTPGQAADGYNWDYVRRGGLQKRGGHDKLNSSPNASTLTLGLGLFDSPALSRSVVRMAGTKIQTFDYSAYTFTDLAKDVAGASTTILSGSSTQPGVFSMFNSPSVSVLWCAGAGSGSAKVWGVVNPGAGLKVTANGVVQPAGSVSVGAMTGADGVWVAGTYYYSFAYRKTSTQSISNAALDVSVTVAGGDTAKHVPLDLSGLTGLDTTLIDKVYIYRSAISGATGFTAGSLIATLNSSTTTFNDKGPGQNSGELSAQVVPRAGNVALDNSVLPAGTYNCVTTWQNRLVTATGSTVYISDTNKPESWPTTNSFTVPSGGAITGLATISCGSYLGSAPTFALCIFKQQELWVLTGTDYTDWVLAFVDNSGCSGQALIVPANGYLAWISFRGAYLWNGSGKPTYVSQPIEDKFQRNGDIDKTKLPIGFGIYAQQRNEIQWYLSSTTYGTQQYCLKLDLRLTLKDPSKAVFSPDVTNMPIYAGLAFLTASDAINEKYYFGDTSGYIYDGFVTTSDSDAAFTFRYTTPYLNMGRPDCTKQYYKIVAWVLNNGSPSLTLEYWSAYRYQDGQGGTVTASTNTGNSNSLIWDQGQWDVNVWDGATNQVTPLVFNLSSIGNSNQGESIRLSFKNSSATSGLILYGFSVYYKDIAVRH